MSEVYLCKLVVDDLDEENRYRQAHVWHVPVDTHLVKGITAQLVRLLCECGSAHYGNAIPFDMVKVTATQQIEDWIGRQLTHTDGLVELSATTKFFECLTVNCRPMTHSFKVALELSIT